MKRLSETLKLDIALPQTTVAAGATANSAFFKLSAFERALFIAELGAMADTATSVIQVLEAPDATGVGAQPLITIVNGVPIPVAATVTANTKVAAATFTAAAADVGATCKVNGVTFTGAAAADPTKNEFRANELDDAETAASLAAVINAAGLGVTATADQAVVTVVPAIPGESTLTVEGTAVVLVAATVKALAYVEVLADHLTDGMTHVGVAVTSAVSNIPTAVTLIRGGARYAPVGQTVAAGYVV